VNTVGAERAARDALEAADALEAEGRHLDAVALLNDANRESRSGDIEKRLVRSRNRGFSELGQAAPSPAQAQPMAIATAPEDDGLPVVGAKELTAEVVAGGVLGHGSLIVRGLVDPERARQLGEGIDRAFEARDAHELSGESGPWYTEFEPKPEYEAAIKVGRGFVKTGSGAWLADSPRMMFDLLETFEAARLREVITGYLGERPAISVNKGTLRRAKPDVGTAWWHQDGAFLGEGIRSLNVWLSLSHCGRDAPGLEIVSRRIDRIVEAGTEGADFDWSVGDPVVRQVAGDQIAKPVFEPGDAVLFDHLLLHRTGVDPSMTATRYATETWFFAPSSYPDPLKQVPLAF
jgi:hypothetical protein